MAGIKSVIFLGIVWTFYGEYVHALTTLADLDDQVATLLDQYFDKQSTIPIQNVRETMNVTVNLQLTSVSNVDADRGYVSVSGYLVVTWIEGRYTSIVDDVWALVPANKIWVPPLRLITSSASSSKVISDNDVAQVHLQSNTVVWKPAVFATVGCTTNQYFPFDEQKCLLQITSNDYATTEMDILTNSTGFLTDEFVENREWSFDSTSAQRHTRDSKAFVEFGFVVKRGSVLHSSLILVPMISACILHLFVFFVPRGTTQRPQYSVLCIVVVMLAFVSTQTSVPRSTDPISIVLFYLMAELFVNIAITVVVIILESFGNKLVGVTSCLNSLTGHGNSSRVRAMQNARTETQTTKSHAAKEGTEVSGDVVTVWDDPDNESVRQQQTNGNPDHRHEGGGTFSMMDVIIFIVFLCIHFILTVGFFVPLGVY